MGVNALATYELAIEGISEQLQANLKQDSEKQNGIEFIEYLRLKSRQVISAAIGCELFVVRKSPITVRKYCKGDEYTILPTFKRIFSTQRSMEHWRWKFEDNPFGSHKIALALDEKGKLAAQYATFPVPFYLSPAFCRDTSDASFPSNIIAMQVGDILTEPSFRNIGRGPTSVLARTTYYFYNKFCINQTPFNYGFLTGPHKKFGKLFLNYEYTTGIPYHVLNLRKMSRISSAFEKMSRIGYSVEKITSVGKEFDQFFKRVKDSYGILIRRNASWLKWRYLDCPDNMHHLFAVKRFNRLMGWGVFLDQGDNLIWGDALFGTKKSIAARILIEQTAARFFSNAKRVIGWFSPAPAWWGEVMYKIGFEIRPEPNRLTPAYAIFDHSFSIEMFEKGRYYTMGDSDLF
jgi:hypothetical protein